MERKVIKASELIVDLFSKEKYYNNSQLIVMDVNTDKAIINVNFNCLLFQDYKFLKKYELISWNSDLYWNDKQQLTCSCIIIWVKKSF